MPDIIMVLQCVSQCLDKTTLQQLPVLVPPIWLCTDNAAAYWRPQAGHISGWELDVLPNLPLTAVN